MTKKSCGYAEHYSKTKIKAKHNGYSHGFSLPVEHANHGTPGPHWAHTCWMVMGQWLQPQRITYGKRDPALVDMWRASSQNMKPQSWLRRRVFTGESEKGARVSRRMVCRIGVFMLVTMIKITCNTDHVSCMEVLCYFCVELKLKINTRSRSIQALKSAHPSLFSSRCWPWEVFNSWLASRDLGTARSSYLARIGPVVSTS